MAGGDTFHALQRRGTSSALHCLCEKSHKEWGNIVTFWEAHITRLSHEGIKHAGAREILIFLAEESFKQDGSNRHVLRNTHSASDPRTLNYASAREFCDPERKISSTMFAIVCPQYSLRRSDFDQKRHGKVASPFFEHIIKDFFHISRTLHSRLHQLQGNHKDRSSRSTTHS